MAHEIGENDKQQGLSMAWHNLTEVLPVIDLKTCFLATWDVMKRKLFRPIASEGTTIYQETTSCEVVCTDNQEIVIGKPVDCETYSLLTNAGFLAIVSGAMAQIAGSFVASVGSVCNRGRIFVSVSIPEYYTKGEKVLSAKFNVAGREFTSYLNFLSSHDKSAPFIVNMGTVCTVCNNTFNMNMMDENNKSLRINIKHTSGMAAQLVDVPAIIGAFFATVERFTLVMTQLALVPINQIDAKAFFLGFLSDKEDLSATDADKAETSTRRTNQVTRLCELFNTGKGNQGLNLADLFSAITDYYSHESSGEKANAFKQIASSEFGNGQTMKALAFVILQDDKRIVKTIANGHKLLANVKS